MGVFGERTGYLKKDKRSGGRREGVAAAVSRELAEGIKQQYIVCIYSEITHAQQSTAPVPQPAFTQTPAPTRSIPPP